MARRTTYTVKQFADAIPGCGGIVFTVAKRVGCDWRTANKWIQTHPTLRQAFDDECETVNDLAESVIIKSIQAGDTADAKWWISRKRREQFTERREVEHQGSIGINAAVLIAAMREGADDVVDD